MTHIDYSEEAVEYEKKLVQVTAALFLPVDWLVLAYTLMLLCLSLTGVVRGGGGRSGTVGGSSPSASFGFYLTEAFQSQTNPEKILYNEIR